MTDKELLELRISDYNKQLEGDEKKITKAEMIEHLGRKIDTRHLGINN